MTGHLRRQVSSLNGPAHTRLTVDGNEGDGSAAEEAKDLLEMANTKTARAMQIHGHAAATKVGFAPLETTQRILVAPPPPPSSHPQPHRPVSAPPSLQTMTHDVNRSPRAKGDKATPPILKPSLSPPYPSFPPSPLLSSPSLPFLSPFQSLYLWHPFSNINLPF